MSVFKGTRRALVFQALEASCIISAVTAELVFCLAQFKVSGFIPVKFYVITAASLWFAYVDLFTSVVITRYILSSAKPEQRERNKATRLAEKLITLLAGIVILDISAAVAFMVDKSTLLPLSIVFIHIITSMMLLQIVHMAIERSVEQERTAGRADESSRADVESHHAISGMWEEGE
jgi:L-asparagine transporter-like permease